MAQQTFDPSSKWMLEEQGASILYLAGARGPLAQCTGTGTDHIAAQPFYLAIYLPTAMTYNQAAETLEWRDKAVQIMNGYTAMIEWLRSRLAGITPLIKARAHTTEKSGRVPAENILALRGIGYFDIVKPRTFGGYEYDFDVLVDLSLVERSTETGPASRETYSASRRVTASPTPSSGTGCRS